MVIQSQVVSAKFRCKQCPKCFFVFCFQPHFEVVENACDRFSYTLIVLMHPRQVWIKTMKHYWCSLIPRESLWEKLNNSLIFKINILKYTLMVISIKTDQDLSDSFYMICSSRNTSRSLVRINQIKFWHFPFCFCNMVYLEKVVGILVSCTRNNWFYRQAQLSL